MIWKIFDNNIRKKISEMKDYFIEDHTHIHVR